MGQRCWDEEGEVGNRDEYVFGINWEMLLSQGIIQLFWIIFSLEWVKVRCVFWFYWKIVFFKGGVYQDYTVEF